MTEGVFQYIINYLSQLEYNNGMDQSNPNLEPQPKPEDHHNDEQNDAMASLLAQEGDGIEFPKSGETRDGVIASITPGMDRFCKPF